MKVKNSMSNLNKMFSIFQGHFSQTLFQEDSSSSRQNEKSSTFQDSSQIQALQVCANVDKQLG